MEGYAAVMIAIWPIGVPMLYLYGFWQNWPIISRLRRAESRLKSTAALSKARRESVRESGGAHSQLLAGELLVTIEDLAPSPDADEPSSQGDPAEASERAEESSRPPSVDTQTKGGQQALADSSRCEVSVAHGKLELRPTEEGSPPLTLQLVAEHLPRASDDGKALLIEGDIASLERRARACLEDGLRRKEHSPLVTLRVRIAGSRRVLLTLAPPQDAAQGRKLSILGLQLPSLMNRRGSTSSAGPSLRDWHAAINKEVPDKTQTMADAEEELKELRLAPILWPYTLRCYWWELFECARKVLLVGLPVFFEPGSSEQLTFGLLSTFADRTQTYLQLVSDRAPSLLVQSAS